MKNIKRDRRPAEARPHYLDHIVAAAEKRATGADPAGDAVLQDAAAAALGEPLPVPTEQRKRKQRGEVGGKRGRAESDAKAEQPVKPVVRMLSPEETAKILIQQRKQRLALEKERAAKVASVAAPPSVATVDHAPSDVGVAHRKKHRHKKHAK
jgi:hypothetical protein